MKSLFALRNLGNSIKSFIESMYSDWLRILDIFSKHD